MIPYGRGVFLQPARPLLDFGENTALLHFRIGFIFQSGKLRPLLYTVYGRDARLTYRESLVQSSWAWMKFAV